ncbi:hypothetical protein DITRI_Ditri02bG0027100 [Diplodiscus trichospermus]
MWEKSTFRDHYVVPSRRGGLGDRGHITRHGACGRLMKIGFVNGDGVSHGTTRIKLFREQPSALQRGDVKMPLQLP